MKTPTVSIGIPAHNEGANIAYVLSDLLRQEIWSFKLTEILIASDGSTDKTVELAGLFADKRIRVFSYRERRGKAFRQNQLIEKSQGDILVLLDADIVMSDPHFLEKLVSPIIKGQADMTSAAITELPPRTFFESVLDVSMQLKHRLFSSFRQGSNLYSCHGPARAFTRPLLEHISFPVNEGEDMYSYLACVFAGFRFKFIPQAIVGYRLPGNFDDHKKQSLRYLHSQKVYRKIFGDEFVDREMHIPLSAYTDAFMSSLPLIVTHAPHVAVYVVVLGIVKLVSMFSYQTQEMWKIASSKVVRV